MTAISFVISNLIGIFLMVFTVFLLGNNILNNEKLMI